MNELRRITPSEISKVIMAKPPGSHNVEAQILGYHEHKRIFHSLAEQAGPLLESFSPPEGPLDIKDLSCNKEVAIQTKISDDLSLSVRVDVLLGGNTCVEIKPKKLGRHALQLMYETMALGDKVDSVHGILYVYNQHHEDDLYNLKDGGKEYWEDGKALAIVAREILDNQNELDVSDRLRSLFRGKKQIITEDTRRRILSPWRKRELSNETISLRHNFDACSLPLIDGLTKLLEKI
ncbi:MAG: hypothetical protein ABII80_00355 [bacterium]